MKLTHNTKLKPGMTLIELTVVIIVLLTLISVLFFAGTAYIKASNRTACLANQATIQKAMRGYATLNQIAEGDDVDWALAVTNGFIAVAPSGMSCPTSKAAYADNVTVPAAGTVISPCLDANEAAAHVPADSAGW